jgi:hypothetical protein
MHAVSTHIAHDSQSEIPYVVNPLVNSKIIIFQLRNPAFCTHATPPVSIFFTHGLSN